MSKSLSASFSGFGSRQLVGVAGYSGERLGLGDSLGAVVLIETDPWWVIIVRPCARGVVVALEDPRPEVVAAYCPGMSDVPDVGEGHG